MAWNWLSSWRNGHRGITPDAAFRPLPLLGNPHLQTLLAHWSPGGGQLRSCERHVDLPDGDKLVLHDSVPARWQSGGQIALLVHGLGGSHQSGTMQRLAVMLLARSVRAVRIDMRGSGRGAAHARRIYNGGCSDDIRAAAAEVRRWDPMARIALIGTSLGGNISLKLAGEAATKAVPGLECVATVAPPIDLEHCARLIALPRNRLYETHFVRELVRQVRVLERFAPETERVLFPRRLTLRLFDELYTAPRGGFQNALDYYHRASAMALISKIAVPTLVLTARDDPFVAVEPFERLKTPGHIEVRIVPQGGHLGFLGWDGAGGIHWAERRIVEWITQDYMSPASPTMRSHLL